MMGVMEKTMKKYGLRWFQKTASVEAEVTLGGGQTTEICDARPSDARSTVTFPLPIVPCDRYQVILHINWRRTSIRFTERRRNRVEEHVFNMLNSLFFFSTPQYTAKDE